MAIKGIDISSWQKNIDWAKAKKDGIEFVIIRAGYGSSLSQKDNQFENHINGALNAGIKVGLDMPTIKKPLKMKPKFALK